MNAGKNLQMFPESKQYLEEFNSTGKFLNDSINQMSEGLNGVQRNVKNKIELNKIELDALTLEPTVITNTLASISGNAYYAPYLNSYICYNSNILCFLLMSKKEKNAAVCGH
jgi:hypothetical protein